MELDKLDLKQIWNKYSKGTLTDFDKEEYYCIRERQNDIGQSTEGLNQKQISRIVRKYHKSIDAYVEISN